MREVKDLANSVECVLLNEVYASDNRLEIQGLSQKKARDVMEELTKREGAVRYECEIRPILSTSNVGEVIDDYKLIVKMVKP